MNKHIYIYIYTYILAQGCDLGVAAWPNRNHFVSNRTKVPRLRVVLRSVFMANWYRTGSTVAQPMPGNANYKARSRLLQRKHSEASCRHMKNKLLVILKPMLNAVYTADLEEFRLSLLANKIEDANSLRVENIGGGTQPPDINRCSCCGIWMPSPIYPTIIIDTATGIQEACSTSEPDPIVCQLEGSS